MFYSDTSSAPKVYLSGSDHYETFTVHNPATGSTTPLQRWRQRVKTDEFEFRGLSLAAADSIAATYAAMTTGEANRYTTSYRRTSEAGTYSVQVSHTVTDTWTTW